MSDVAATAVMCIRKFHSFSRHLHHHLQQKQQRQRACLEFHTTEAYSGEFEAAKVRPSSLQHLQLIVQIDFWFLQHLRECLQS